MVSIKFQHIQHSLGVALIVLTRYRGLSEQLAPLFGHALHAL